MAGQNETTLSREAKKEILKVHMHYVRDGLKTCECFYRAGELETYLKVIKKLFNSSSYLESIGVLSLEKYLLLNDIITNFSDRIIAGEVCTA